MKQEQTVYAYPSDTPQLVTKEYTLCVMLDDSIYINYKNWQNEFTMEAVRTAVILKAGRAVDKEGK